MIIGYARTSTVEQEAGLEAQQRDLRAAGAERVFLEQISSLATTRPELENAIAFAREDDTFIVTKPDRLARSVAQLISIVARLQTKGVQLRILSMGVDTATPTGRLMLTLLGAVAEFEREIMLERQREGIAKAQREGRYKGRSPVARNQRDKILELDSIGYRRSAIAKQLNLGLSSVYRVISEAKRAEV